MKNRSLTKLPFRTFSMIISLIIWVFLCSLSFYIIKNFKDSASLVRDNENERIYNMLFASLNNYEDFGSAIDDIPALSERIAGFAVYGRNLSPLYSWGKTPNEFDEALLEERSNQGRYGRFTIPDRKSNSIKFIISVAGILNPEMPRLEREPSQQSGMMGMGRNQMMGQRSERMPRTIERQGFPFFNILASGGYYYTDIYHHDYWRTITIGNILFPLSCVVLLAGVMYIRRLYLRNHEYREKIEEQKNLVVLGTAAGTLAHEIKTPLSSIRLQTGILEKLHDSGREEIGIINEEVDRLSSLSRRINDYLREGEGNPEKVNLCDLLEECAARLCGSGVIAVDSAPGAFIYADEERLRSIFENLIRNALESGSKTEDLEIAVSINGEKVNVFIRDRGEGIRTEDLDRIFDPFFTRKSSGTGIGLSVCKRFAEAAGAAISIKNRGDGTRGAEALVTFPLYDLSEGGVK